MAKVEQEGVFSEIDRCLRMHSEFAACHNALRWKGMALPRKMQAGKEARLCVCTRG
jgi:hypothetical protein